MDTTGGVELAKKDFKILYCDDSLLVRKQLKEILNQEGYTNLIEAADGEEVVKKYQSENPDLVFCDIVMPRLDGLEALNRIKARDQSARIVMISTSGTRANLIRALDEGAVDFVQKPLNPERVKKIVAREIKGGRGLV